MNTGSWEPGACGTLDRLGVLFRKEAFITSLKESFLDLCHFLNLRVHFVY